MDAFGDIIRKLREDKTLPLRIVAAYLDIDQAILSKIERGKRKPTREHVVKLAKYFKVKEKDLMVAWLSDNLVYQIADEQLALKALQMAEEKIAYRNNNKIFVKHPIDLPKVIKLIQRYFNSHSLISKAWLFGSYVRGENTPTSDIDILIDVPTEQKFTLLDIAEVQEQLQKILNIKVDVVMINGMKSGIKERVENEMLLIYET